VVTGFAWLAVKVVSLDGMELVDIISIIRRAEYLVFIQDPGKCFDINYIEASPVCHFSSLFSYLSK
jgi:hypothetical protein